MHLTDQINPDMATLKEFVANYPADTPVVMLNLLKFKDRTGNGDETGEKAYNRYGYHVQPFLQKAGAKLLWAGTVAKTLVGTSEGQPDRVLLVQYPSKETFLSMVSSEDYQKVAADREIALEYGGLIATETIKF